MNLSFSKCVREPVSEGVCVCVFVWTEFTGSEQSPPPDTGRSAEALEGSNEEGKKMSRRKGG